MSSEGQMVDVVYLHPDDNTCVAARNLKAGETVHAGETKVTMQEDVPMGHKVSIQPIESGSPAVKYGQAIGTMTEGVASGDWVHAHNLEVGEFETDYAISSEIPDPPTPITGRTFQGYRRSDGKAGTRNYIAVISIVNCSASVSKFISQRFDQETLKDYPNIDGVIGLTHPTGCGMEYRGLNHQFLTRVLGGMARHPNIGGYLLIGLGCEQGAMEYLLKEQNLVQIDGDDSAQPSKGPIVLSMQDIGGTQKTVEEGVRLVQEMLPRVNDVRREPIPASEIILGTECGGSDGNSGITANPGVGAASDMLVASGATSILSETSEIYGAEHLLTRRSRSKEVAEKLLERIDWWKWYAGIFGGELDNNPSHGNKKGGLTTIVEKSLGAVAKAGATTLEAVYEYAEPVTAKGLVVMDTPGYDTASITGLVAGGANVVVFTTGRGSCYGCKPVPSIKIATNTPMYERMSDDMDINAGTVLTGTSIQELGSEIYEEILSVASGKKTKSEQHGIGEEEFTQWIVGPVL